MNRRRYKYTYKRYHKIPVGSKPRRQAHGTPLLSALAVSMLCTSLASAVGAHSIYQKYDTDGWSQPVVTVLMQGLANHQYPWNTSARTGTGGPSVAAGSQANTGELPVSFVEQDATYASDNVSAGLAGSSSAGGASAGQVDPSLAGSAPTGLDDSSPAGNASAGEADSSLADNASAGQSGSSPTDNTSAGGSGSSSADGFSGQLEQENTASPDHGPYTFTQVTQEYFDDALLIGDSRAEGVKLYSGWDNLTYYAEGGMTIYNMFQSQTAQVDGRKASIEEALQNHSFGKIYLEIGINEMGTGTVDSFMEAYEEAVTRLRELQPDAILYVCGIMYVKQSKSESDPIFNNPNIQARNDRIAQLADGEHIFYLDINELVTDETGNLNPDYTWDEVHLLGKYDSLWLDYFCSHGIVKNSSDNS